MRITQYFRQALIAGFIIFSFQYAISRIAGLVKPPHMSPSRKPYATYSIPAKWSVNIRHGAPTVRPHSGRIIASRQDVAALRRIAKAE